MEYQLSEVVEVDVERVRAGAVHRDLGAGDRHRVDPYGVQRRRGVGVDRGVVGCGEVVGVGSLHGDDWIVEARCRHGEPVARRADHPYGAVVGAGHDVDVDRERDEDRVVVQHVVVDVVGRGRGPRAARGRARAVDTWRPRGSRGPGGPGWPLLLRAIDLFLPPESGHVVPQRVAAGRQVQRARRRQERRRRRRDAGNDLAEVAKHSVDGHKEVVDRRVDLADLHRYLLVDKRDLLRSVAVAGVADVVSVRAREDPGANEQ